MERYGAYRDEESSNEVNLTVSSKEKLRRELEKQVEEFLKRGGKIQVLEPGAKSKIDPSVNDDDEL